MNDLIIKNCIDFDGNKTDILIKDGIIKENSPNITIENIKEVDAKNQQDTCGSERDGERKGTSY